MRINCIFGILFKNNHGIGAVKYYATIASANFQTHGNKLNAVITPLSYTAGIDFLSCNGSLSLVRIFLAPGNQNIVIIIYSQNSNILIACKCSRVNFNTVGRPVNASIG